MQGSDRYQIHLMDYANFSIVTHWKRNQLKVGRNTPPWNRHRQQLLHQDSHSPHLHQEVNDCSPGPRGPDRQPAETTDRTKMTTSKIALVTLALLLSTVTSYAQHCNDAADCAMWDRMDAIIHRDDRKLGRYDDPFSRENWPQNHYSTCTDLNGVQFRCERISTPNPAPNPGAVRAEARAAAARATAKAVAPSDGAPCIYDGVPVDCH